MGANVAPDKPLPADGVIQIAFDRFLLPLSVNRQSFALRDAFGNAPLSPTIVYDPVARVVTIATDGERGVAWLTPNQSYTVHLGVPRVGDDSGGPLAIDRATLDPAGGPYEIGFTVSPAPTPRTPDPETQVDYCRDVSPVFQAKCSGGGCHHAQIGASLPAAGLLLQTWQGVQHTAITRVAQGSNTGGVAGTGSAPGHVFGIDMPLVDPGDPGNSWLMYKVLLGRPRDVDATLDASTPPCTATSLAPRSPLQSPPPSAPVTDDERTRLAQYILGREMPYPLNLPAETPTPQTELTSLPLTFDELERVRAWIAQGAIGSDCPQCAE